MNAPLEPEPAESLSDAPGAVSSPRATAASSEAATFAQALAELDRRSLRRRLRRIGSAAGSYVSIDGRQLCCLCSNNYLGLANHPQVTAAVAEALKRWGWGAGASRLVSGHTALHEELEAALASFEHVVLVDRLNHASIIDACRGSGARMRVFRHRDYEQLERLLAAARGARRRVIVTDSLFSMDGDIADLPRLVSLRQRYDALLCVDEAHATGVFGKGGQGLAQEMGVAGQIDVTVGTLSKALGGIGGFIAASREIIDWIINTAGPFIYTTAIPAAACAGALAALTLVASPEGARRRAHLLELAGILRRELTARGFDIAGSASQIVPLIVGESDAALKLSSRLEAEGFWVPAIRPPTVPRGSARLRISLCADHRHEDIERFLQVLDRITGGRGNGR